MKILQFKIKNLKVAIKEIFKKKGKKFNNVSKKANKYKWQNTKHKNSIFICKVI